MLIYVLLILWIYGAWYLSRSLKTWNKKRQRLLFLGLSFGALFLVCAFRDDSVSWDMANYLLKYKQIRNVSLGYILTHLYTQRVEFGYALINKILGWIFTDPHTIIIFMALVTTILWVVYLYFNYDQQDDLNATLIFTCCGIYLHHFGFIRQMLAISLLMNAWAMLTRKKYRQSAILFLLACTQHYMSVCFLLAYLFYFLRKRPTTVYWVAGIGGFLLINLGPILKLAGRFFHRFSYLGKTDTTLSLGGIYLVWIVELVVLLWLFAQYALPKKLPELLRLPAGLSDLQTCCVPLFVLMYIAFTCMGAFYNNVDRIGLFFLPFIIPMFCDFGPLLQKKYPKLFPIYQIGLQVGFVGLFLLTVSADHYQYSFFWQH